MNNKPRRTIIVTLILVVLSLTGIAAFAMGYHVIANDSEGGSNRSINIGTVSGY